QIDLNSFIPILERRIGMIWRGSVVNQDVETTEGRFRERQQPAYFIFNTDIGVEECPAPPLGFDETKRFAAAFVVDIANHNPRSFPSESPCNGSARSAASRAGHDERFITPVH